MAKIVGIENMTDQQINQDLQNGARFVIFQYCISIIVMSFRRSSDIYFVRAGESVVGRHIGFTLLTAVLGWWGIPWGPIYSVQSLYCNLRGGKDVTQDVLRHLGS